MTSPDTRPPNKRDGQLYALDAVALTSAVLSALWAHWSAWAATGLALLAVAVLTASMTMNVLEVRVSLRRRP